MLIRAGGMAGDAEPVGVEVVVLQVLQIVVQIHGHRPSLGAGGLWRAVLLASTAARIVLEVPGGWSPQDSERIRRAG